MIKAVFLDVGGTLITPQPSVGGVYSAVAARHGVAASAEQLDTVFRGIWKDQRATRAAIDKDWWRQIVTGVFAGHSFRDFESFFDDVYAAFEMKEHWRIFDDVIPALTGLKGHSQQVAVLSNWDSRLPGLLKKLGLDQFFDRQFISFELGLSKPDPRFFQHALEQMGLHPSEAIHIGDDPLEDIKGAESAGLRAYLLDRNARPLNSRMMKSLDEVFVRI